MLARLVAFDTTSHKSNLDLIAFVEDYLLQHGVASTRVPSPEGDKACLFATIGPDDIGGIALSGHTDVVPVDGQTWDSDPFTLREADGRLYGRGTMRYEGLSRLRAGVGARLPSAANSKRRSTLRFPTTKKSAASASAR